MSARPRQNADGWDVGPEFVHTGAAGRFKIARLPHDLPWRAEHGVDKRQKRKSAASRRGPRASKPAEDSFQAEVAQCVRELHRIMPFLLADYAEAAVAASLAIHAVRSLSVCVRSGQISAHHARALIERMAQLKLPSNLERL